MLNKKENSRPRRSRPQDPKREENSIGKEVVDAAVCVPRSLGPGPLDNFGAARRKDGIKRIINELEDKSLGVFGSWGESPTMDKFLPTESTDEPAAAKPPPKIFAKKRVRRFRRGRPMRTLLNRPSGTASYRFSFFISPFPLSPFPLHPSNFRRRPSPTGDHSLLDK